MVDYRFGFDAVIAEGSRDGNGQVIVLNPSCFGSADVAFIVQCSMNMEASL